MKAIITAGGRGTRLRPITHNVNKHLIPLANKPMIYYAIEKTVESGIVDIGIVINVGDTEISANLGDGSQFGAKFTYIEQVGGPLGLAHVIKVCKNFLQDDAFLYYLGDNIVLKNMKHIIDKFQKEKCNALVCLVKAKNLLQFGVPEIKDGKIIRIEEKPQIPKSEYAVSGVYFFDHHIFEAVENIKPSARGELEISDANTYLIDHGYTVGYDIVDGWWKDTGTIEDLLEGNQLILDEFNSGDIKTDKSNIGSTVVMQGKVTILENTVIEGQVLIRGPVTIGRDCRIVNSYIGPYTSIGNDVEVENCEIENSIVLDYVDINCSARIIDSVIGYNATIRSAKATLPSGHKVIIGDNCIIEL